MPIQGRLAAIAAAALMLAGCDPASTVQAPAQGSAQATIPAAIASFKCPPAGTRATYSNGGPVEWVGPDAGDPAVCVVRATGRAGITEQKRFLNYWAMSDVDAELRAGMARLFPLAVGQQSSFRRTGRTAGTNMPVIYDETWRVLRRDSFEVAGRPRPAWVLGRSTEFSSIGTGSTRTEFEIWIDEATGIVLKQTVQNVRGLWRGSGPFEVTSLQVR